MIQFYSYSFLFRLPFSVDPEMAGHLRFPPGDHRVDFAFQLPTDIPSSCRLPVSSRGDTGSVAYKLRVSAERSYRVASAKQFLLVRSVVPLNTHMEAMVKTTGQYEKLMPISLQFERIRASVAFILWNKTNCVYPARY